MQEKSLDELAVSYKETSSEKVFVEIQKPLRPAIQRWSQSARSRVSRDDMDQCAALAIAIALLRYEPGRGSFAASVIPYLRGEFYDAAEQSRDVRIPDSDRLRGIIVHVPRVVAAEMANGATRQDALDVAARRYDISTSEIERVFASCVGSEDIDKADLMTGDSQPAMSGEHRRIVFDALETLSPEERRIVARRYLRDEADSLRAIADDEVPGSTRGVKVVSERAMTALSKMRAALEAGGISAHDVFA